MLVLCSLIASVGCQSMRSKNNDGPLSAPTKLAEKLDLPDGVPWKGKKKAKQGVPTRIVATWTDTVLQQTGKPATRGFGGKLFFYGPNPKEPIAVEGQLVVYAFDEADRKQTDNRPTKRFVFPPAQFAIHQGETELGVAYSFWLPWDEVGGMQTDVSLIARFEPIKSGSLIVSDQAKLRLAGQLNQQMLAPKTMLASHVASQPTGVQQASHEEPEAVAKQGKLKLETTTINLPSGYRLRGGKTSSETSPKKLQPKATVTTPAVKPVTEVIESAETGVKTTVSYVSPNYASPGESVRRQLSRPSAGSLLDRSRVRATPSVR